MIRKRSKFHYPLALLAGLLILLAGMQPAAGSAPPPVLLVDGEITAPAAPLLREQGVVLASLRDIAVYLNAQVQWDESQGTAWIEKDGQTLWWRLQAAAWPPNSEPAADELPARIFGDAVYVPLRPVVEQLGAAVVWDQNANSVQIITAERHNPPQRVGQSFNALVAYTHQGHLWLQDGREPQLQPQQITNAGRAQPVGWSADGSWLAFTLTGETLGSDTYLWVLRADDGTARLVDNQPLGDSPQWSPRENMLAFITSTGAVKYAAITAADIQTNTLTAEDTAASTALAWHPTEQSLTVAFPRTGDKPPALEQITLDGQREVLYTLQDETPVDPEGIYPAAFTGLKWSADGRYLAYHLRPNSGSLTADSVEAGLFDPAHEQLIQLSDGLQYQQWLTFSPDNQQLAHIAGSGREATRNKQLELMDLSTGETNNFGANSNADTQPVWLPGDTGSLLFCRGPESPAAAFSPGQRIYALDSNGEISVVTSGTADTADYYPSPAPSGRQLIFLRLVDAHQGSLYLQTLDPPQPALEIIRGLQGDPGYYGNYYPQWISVCWLSAQT